MTDINANLLSQQYDAARLAAQSQNVQQAQSRAESARDMEKVRETAQQFEAMFVSQMLSHMYTDINPNNNPYGGGKGEEVFRSLMIDEYGKMISKTGRLGIADMVEKEMLRMQEMAQN